MRRCFVLKKNSRSRHWSRGGSCSAAMKSFRWSSVSRKRIAVACSEPITEQKRATTWPHSIAPASMRNVASTCSAELPGVAAMSP